MSSVAQHAGRFRHDRNRVVESLQHLQHRARQLQRALHRLIRVGVRAERQGPRDVARLAQLAFQQLADLGLEDELGFEVEAGRVAEIGVRRAGVAIDAAMLAAPVRVHRAVEADVGALVPADDRPRGIAGERGRQRRQIANFGCQRVPSVVERAGGLAVEPRRRVDRRPAAAPGRRGHDGGRRLVWQPRKHQARDGVAVRNGVQAVVGRSNVAHGMFPFRSRRE